MKKHMICILGGSGFVGRHLVNQLVKAGHHVRLITRRIERQRDLLIWPTVDVVEANIHDAQALHTHFAGCDTVVNLVAILNESKKTTFQTVHVDLARNVAQACLAQGVKRLLHMSALNADARQGASAYLRSKGEAEDVVHSASEQGLRVTSFRPSVIFGPNDHLFNRFAGLLRYAPLIPLACPDARFAPVYVGDVVHAFMVALDERATLGQRYDLCGPRTYTLEELMEYAASVIGVKRPIIGLGDTLSRIMAGIMEHAPGKPLTRDNYLSMQVDSVCHGEFPAVFGTQQTSVETAVPLYLNRRDQRARYYDFRRVAGRD
ncbi:MAG: complex I NDUFA9 subunit family protein [Gammaproteobacteria bacterium]